MPKEKGLILRLGDKTPPPYDEVSGMGAILDLNKEGIHIATLIDNPTAEEIESASVDKMTVGLLQHGDAVFFVLAFGQSLVFDCSFNAAKVHPDMRGLPKRDPEAGLTFSAMVACSVTKRIKALRFATTSPHFSRTLEALVAKMNKKMEKKDYRFERDYQSAMRTYPDPFQMLTDCLIVEEAGRPFTSIDHAMSRTI